MKASALFKNPLANQRLKRDYSSRYWPQHTPYLAVRSVESWSSSGWLWRLVCPRSAYVMDSTSSLVQNVLRNLVYLVNGLFVFRNLLQNILVRVSPGFESTTGI